MNPYTTSCDEFGVFTYLNTRLDLSSNPETVLHFFEAIQKIYPRMTEFERRDNGEYLLEEDREQGSYRSVGLDARRVWSGYMNPSSLEDADEQHERVLEMAPFHLDLGALITDSLDTIFTFDFLYTGNHDEVVAEALAGSSPFENLLQLSGARVLNFEPSMMLALDEQCRLQCRLSVETRTNAYQVQTGQFPENAPITVYFTVRQFWGKQPFKTFVESYRNQRRIAQELVDAHVIPNVVKPLAATISAK
jgi:hypothetical protein